VLRFDWTARRCGFAFRTRRREDLAEQVAFLRAHRGEVTVFLRSRTAIPPMPPRVRLVVWNLKEPPVGIETATVVVNPALFARTTLVQLGAALANPTRWVGWSIPQLIDRLAQVGVTVVVEASQRYEREPQRATKSE